MSHEPSDLRSLCLFTFLLTHWQWLTSCIYIPLFSWRPALLANVIFHQAAKSRCRTRSQSPTYETESVECSILFIFPVISLTELVYKIQGDSWRCCHLPDGQLYIQTKRSPALLWLGATIYWLTHCIANANWDGPVAEWWPQHISELSWLSFFVQPLHALLIYFFDKLNLVRIYSHLKVTFKGTARSMGFRGTTMDDIVNSISSSPLLKPI